MTVVLEELQLRQRHLGGFVGPRARVLPPQLRPQAVDTGAPHHLRIGGRDVRLPPRLRQPADLRRVHLALPVSPATEMPTRRPMHRCALRHLDDQRAAARRRRRRHPEQAEVQRRLHAVRTDLGHEVGQRIQLCGDEPLWPALVGHAENEPSASAVGQCRQPVGQVVPSGTDDTAAAEAGLELGVLTECDLPPKVGGVDWHRVAHLIQPCRCAHERQEGVRRNVAGSQDEKTSSRSMFRPASSGE